MATSAFKSTTKRTPIGGSGSSGSLASSSSKAHRRSRSLSRFGRPLLSEDDDNPTPEYKHAPRGKFVNTNRGSAAFPDISLDDLALELFSSNNETNESDGGAAAAGKRDGRSVSRSGSSVGRWASDTASSRRRGRSVSRSGAKSVVSNDTRGRTVAPPEASSRRRRSVSVARYQISDSEGEVNHLLTPSNRANSRGRSRGKAEMLSSQKATNSSNRKLGRSFSQKDFTLLNDGYSSHSSALTDDELKDSHFTKNGIGKTNRTVHIQKAEHPSKAVLSGKVYEAMRKEFISAVQEIRTELNHAVGRSGIGLASSDCLELEESEVCRDLSTIRKSCATKLEQSEKRKQDLLAEILLEEERGRELSKIVKELRPDSKGSGSAQKPARVRKRSNDRNRMMSKRLSEEAEKYFEDFISNVEDTDFSSFDGERSDGSSTLGARTVTGDSMVRGELESYQSPAGSSLCPVEMDGVVLPWLQWETSNDGSHLGKNKAQTPVTPKSTQRNSEKDMQGQSGYSNSSHGSWSPGLFFTSINDSKGKTRPSEHGKASHFDMDEYIKLQTSEELAFEICRQQNRISSGGLLLCTNSVLL